jgi:hypothetical protein
MEKSISSDRAIKRSTFVTGWISPGRKTCFLTYHDFIDYARELLGEGETVRRRKDCQRKREGERGKRVR